MGSSMWAQELATCSASAINTPSTSKQDFVKGNMQNNSKEKAEELPGPSGIVTRVNKTKRKIVGSEKMARYVKRQCRKVTSNKSSGMSSNITCLNTSYLMHSPCQICQLVRPEPVITICSNQHAVHPGCIEDWSKPEISQCFQCALTLNKNFKPPDDIYYLK